MQAVSIYFIAFNSTVMEWMVVARLRLDKQTSEAYALAFESYLIIALKAAGHLKLARLYWEWLWTAVMQRLLVSNWQ